jgi:hypothetical protein
VWAGKIGIMNRTELRLATSELAERAKSARDLPSPADIALAHSLFDCRKEFLAATLSSSVELKWCEEPDWKTWQRIAEFFDKYHAALVEIDNKSADGLGAIRRQGI